MSRLRYLLPGMRVNTRYMNSVLIWHEHSGPRSFSDSFFFNEIISSWYLFCYFVHVCWHAMLRRSLGKQQLIVLAFVLKDLEGNEHKTFTANDKTAIVMKVEFGRNCIWMMAERQEKQSTCNLY